MPGRPRTSSRPALADTGATPRLAERIRAKAGNLDAFYHAPTPDAGFVSAANLTPQRAQEFMPLIFYTMLALVREFLPHMLERGDGAIPTAQGGSTVHGLPNMSGPSPAQAAQRNYLQAMLWTMHDTKGQREVIYP